MSVNEKSNININLMKDYVIDNAILVSKDLGISMEDAKGVVNKIIDEYKSNGKFRDPVVEYMGKNTYGDRVLKKKNLLNYLESTSHGIVVPAGTVYAKHETEMSVHTENTNERVRKRSVVKKEAAMHEIKGEVKLAAQKNRFQTAYKAGNNAVTGLMDNMYNPFYNPSGHYALTSITATVTTIGNMVSESMIAGNRLYNRPEIVINHIISTISNTNLEAMDRVIKKYKIYIPTAIECMSVILKSTRFYWGSQKHDDDIRDVLSKLNDIERAAFVYTNDLYHFRHYNSDLCKRLFNKLLEVHNDSEDPKKDMDGIPEDIEVMVKSLLYDDMLEHSKNKETISFKDDLFMDTKKKLASTARHSYNFLEKINDLVSVFFMTDNLPINVSDIKDMMRKCTVLSDTDSTCSTYQDWVMWYHNRQLPKFTSDEIGISGAVLLFVYRTLAHSLELFSNRMNITGKYSKLLAMKNEFYWKTMIFMNMTKHYFADTAIKEGNVFAKTKLELKGSNLIDSKLPADLQEKSKGYYSKITDIITSGQKVNIHKIVKEIADIELDIIKRMKSLDTDIMKEETVLDHTSYKGGKLGSVYYHFMLWNEVFGEKYGVIEETPVVCVKVKTNMVTKKSMVDSIESIKDDSIRNNFKKFIEKYPKNALETLRLPKEVVLGVGLPEELQDIMVVKPAVLELCSTFYFILESLGVYKKPGYLLSDLIQ